MDRRALNQAENIHRWKKEVTKSIRHGTTSSLALANSIISTESSFSGVGGEKQKNETVSHKEL
jgi:hypothetical protein